MLVNDGEIIMNTQTYLLEFDEMDHPAQLGKVGQWVITFSENPVNPHTTELKMTDVMPLQHDQGIQIRQLSIQHLNEHLWKITQIQYQKEEMQSTNQSEIGHIQQLKLLNKIIENFRKYDVNIKLYIQ